jgi:hypothetical protein
LGSKTSFDYATVAYNASTGTRRWVARYNGPGHGDDSAYALGVSPHGAIVFVTGGSTGSNGSFGFATVAYTARTGERRWVARVGSGSATALAVSPARKALFVTGHVGQPISDYETVAYTYGRIA